MRLGEAVLYGAGGAAITMRLRHISGHPQQCSGRPMGDTHRHLTTTDDGLVSLMDDLQRSRTRFQVLRAEEKELVAIAERSRDALSPAPAGVFPWVADVPAAGCSTAD
jgi:hypothetical protein